jgi:hypothetical protein
MSERCYRCGSVNLRAINAEISFALGTADPVYALGRPVVCLDCGFAECSLSEEPLQKLKERIRVRGPIDARRGATLKCIA